MQDAECLEAWAAGDNKAGNLLFDRHYRSVYRFFANKLSGLSEVEDLVQRTFMACIEARERFRGDSSFRTFVFGIARNTLLKYLRDSKARAIEPAATSMADCGMGTSTAVGLRREQQVLLTALRQLPIDSQVVLELSFWEHMTGKEIAEVLGETEPAIRGRLRKAKLELRGAVEAVARNPQELESTIGGMDTWAEGLRDYWRTA